MKSIKKVDAYYVDPVPYESLESAISAVDKGYATAAVHFYPDYSEALDRRISGAQDEDIDNETLSRSSLHLWLDNTNFLYANGLIDSLRMTLYETIGDIFNENNMSRIDAPLRVVETVYAQNSKLSDFLLPGYLISFMYLSQVRLCPHRRLPCFNQLKGKTFAEFGLINFNFLFQILCYTFLV